MPKNLKKKPVKPEIDAGACQTQLATLANTLALKVQREVIETVKPSFVAVGIYVMLRQFLSIYQLFFLLNADERWQKDAL